MDNQQQFASTDNAESKHKNYWDKIDQAIITEVSGGYDEQDAQETSKAITEIQQQFPGKRLKFLIDLTKANKVSSQARKIIAEKIYKDPDLGKIATFGQDNVARLVNRFMIKASGLGSDRIKVFETKEQAFKWLKE